MHIVLSDFISLDGVVQAPGGQEEDTDAGFAHGGWSTRYFEPETMGPAITEVMANTEALLFGRRTWQTMAAAWPSRAGDPFADHSRMTTSAGLARRCCLPTMPSARCARCARTTAKRYKSWAARRWRHNWSSMTLSTNTG